LPLAFKVQRDPHAGDTAPGVSGLACTSNSRARWCVPVVIPCTGWPC